MILSDLVSELIQLVVEQLHDDPSALQALALTNSQFQAHAEGIFYRHIFIRKGEQCVRLLESINSHPSRASAVRSIEARCLYDCVIGLPKLQDILLQTRDLRKLIMESPDCNYNYWQRRNHSWPTLMYSIRQMLARDRDVCVSPMEERRPLSRLKALTLHWNGVRKRYWTVEGPLGNIFAHPTLEELTLSCANLDVCLPKEVRKQESTPLKKLTLIECNITVNGLREMLSMPEGLEFLSLGENRHHLQHRESPYGGETLLDDTDGFFGALAQQRHSLKQLHYDAKPTSRSAPSTYRFKSNCFADFVRLDTILVKTYCPILVKMSCLEETAPPGLETFELHHDPTPHNALGDDQDMNAGTGRIMIDKQLSDWCIHLAHLPSLRHVNIIGGSNSGLVVEVDQRHQVLEHAKEKFAGTPVKFLAYTERRVGGFFPPYLYGEFPPNRIAVTLAKPERENVGSSVIAG